MYESHFGNVNFFAQLIFYLYVCWLKTQYFTDCNYKCQRVCPFLTKWCFATACLKFSYEKSDHGYNFLFVNKLVSNYFAAAIISKFSTETTSGKKHVMKTSSIFFYLITESNDESKEKTKLLYQEAPR